MPASRIDTLELNAKFIGDPVDADGVAARLKMLWKDEMTGPLAAACHSAVGANAAITRIPDLTVDLSLTRQELDSPRAVELFTLAFTVALEKALQKGEGVWQFQSDDEFLVAYMLARIGLSGLPFETFTEFQTLNLLSPLQALQELLRSRLTLWQALSRVQKGSAHQFVTALLRTAGTSAAAALLATLLAQSAPDRKFPAKLADWVAQSDLTNWQEAAAYGDSDLALYFSLRLFGEGWVGYAGAGIILGPLARWSRDAEHTFLDPDNPAAFLSALQDEFGSRSSALMPHLLQAAHTTSGCAALVRIVQFFAEQTPSSTRQKSKNINKLKQADRDVASSKASTKPNTDRVYTSPFAGVALLVPFLCRNGMGDIYSAAMRCTALADLCRSDVFPQPQDNDFLAALCGTDDEKPIPERPAAADVTDFPPSKAAEILALPAGPERLSAWLLAMFAVRLPGLGHSSLAFLQRQFFHTPGKAVFSQKQINVFLEPPALKTVLDIGGHFDEADLHLGWLENRTFLIICGEPYS